MGQDSNQIRQQIEETRAQMGETVAQIGHEVDVPTRIKESIAGRVETVKESINGTRASVSHAIGGTLSDASSKAVSAGKAIGVSGQNPLGLALAALAMGFVAGMLVPGTDIEREKLGPISNSLVGQAKDAADDIVAQGRTMVTTGVQAATDAVKSQMNGDTQTGEMATRA